jgi:2',3'-cyclic-nucleotide 2'-phosphodiesterase
MKILYFGDVVGRVGRVGVKKVLPQIIAEHHPDLIIANAENLAHGTGITPKTIQELKDAGVHFFTSGNHVWDKPLGEELLQDKNPVVIRPYNYGKKRSGVGYKELTVSGNKILVINLQGQVWMKDEVENPFKALDEILSSNAPKNYAAILVDLHAEATSEKVALGWYADGRASLVVGSHTHVPTADSRILPQGTAYITDIGMSGARNSVIGVKTQNVINRFLGQPGGNFEYDETGVCDVNAVLVEIGTDRKAASIKQLQYTVET